MVELRYYLLLDHVQIQGANAISSPLTYGFPSINGFLGAIHALSRKIKAYGYDEIYLDGVMIACHQCDVQIYRPHNFADYTFKLTRNPISKDGKTRSIIEEGKVNLNVSLVVELKCSRDAINSENQSIFEQQIKYTLMQQRIAGGSVHSVWVTLFQADEDKRSIIHRLLPAFVLINAQQDLQEITKELQADNPHATQLDALIETAKLHQKPQNNREWQTYSIKKGRGWLVPIHVGYQAISPLFAAGKVTNTRDNIHSTQFVECIYSLGKWQFPLRLYLDFEHAFWRYQSATKQSNDAELYLIDQEHTDY